MFKQVLTLMEIVCNNLKETGILDSEIELDEKTVLIGKGTRFDSIGFVTFFMEMEDKLTNLYGREVYLVLDELLDDDSEKGTLTIQDLINYIIQKNE